MEPIDFAHTLVGEEESKYSNPGFSTQMNIDPFKRVSNTSNKFLRKKIQALKLSVRNYRRNNQFSETKIRRINIPAHKHNKFFWEE